MHCLAHECCFRIQVPDEGCEALEMVGVDEVGGIFCLSLFVFFSPIFSSSSLFLFVSFKEGKQPQFTQRVRI